MNSLSTSVKNYLEYCHTQKGLNPKTLKAYSTVKYISVSKSFSNIAKTCEGASVNFFISSSKADEGTYTLSS